ncbi:hypothetical protein DPM19_14565 [Actinomadura craniellae]|uniref:Uncharacterized protein n=1 Tax=Actinomadura craniellae TaxID=2231787 RepID=A0A365H522_9ACTN|nr:hypothetical protein DPM19_14565 [Actinomadura craniellae]
MAADYKVPTSCNGMFALVTVDFEPATTYTFRDVAPEPPPARPDWMSDATWAEILRSDAETLRAYKEVFAAAMCEELGALPVGVLLTRFRYHQVDSSERGFAEAARRAVRNLHRRVPASLAAPVRGVHARSAGTYVNGRAYVADVTVDFEPAERYEFTDRTGSHEIADGHAAALDAAVGRELGDPPLRVVLTGGLHREVSERGFGDLALPVVRELRKHL